MRSWRNRYSGRVLIAVAAPVVAVAVGTSLVLAGPALAAGSATPPPFPTSICGTGSPSASASQSSSASPSASATTQPSASPSSSSPSASASPSASPSSSTPTANSPDQQQAPAPSSTPSASGSSSSGGFWGWLNGVWSWILGDSKLLHVAAAPALRAGGVALAADDPSTDSSGSDAATCVPSGDLKSAPANGDANGSCSGNVAAQTPWVMQSPSVVMYDMTYNGVTTIPTYDASDGKCDTTMTVMDFTMSKITIESMVTYSHVGDGMLQFNNGGSGETTTLTNVQLYITSMQANILGLIGATFTPTSTPTALLGLLQGFTVPIPLLFTDVNTDIALLNSGSIAVPNFAGYGSPDS